MIRNVCIHVNNEQPLLADLYSLPSASDAGLVCTNVRGLDGKRPVFIDHMGSTFFFPYHVVRFLEIPAGAMAHAAADDGPDAARGETLDAAAPGPDAGMPVAPGAADPAQGSLLPVVVGGADDGLLEDDGLDLEIDEGFLQRIRDI